MFFAISNGHMHVKCTNSSCTNPADTKVDVTAVAPGVLAVPYNLICENCQGAVFTYPCTCKVDFIKENEQ